MPTALTDIRARSIRPSNGALADGVVPGLRLLPTGTRGQGKWILRFVSPVTGKRRDMGLGSYPVISIANVRRSAMELRSQIAQGCDPIEERRRNTAELEKIKAIPTFEEAARTVHHDIAAGFRNTKHAAQWINTLEAYTFPKIGRISVTELTVGDFANVLKPIWLAKPETASRVKQRMDRVMNWCAAHGFIAASPLPAVPVLLPAQLGKQVRTVHHPAVPWRDLPMVVRHIFEVRPLSKGKLALLFTILTAVRSGEVRAMIWKEIDFENRIWTIPADRTKTRKMHRVPLAPAAMTILEDAAELSDGSGFVFPSRRGTPLSDMTLTKILRQHDIASDTPGRIATVHGFRSTFRDWAFEHGYPYDVAERALAHTIRNQIEAAYHRTDLLDMRRTVMEVWAEFVVGPHLSINSTVNQSVG